jgi:hypothetical protein
MDLSPDKFFLSFITLFITCATVMAADFEYVSPQVQRELEARFDQARFNSSKSTKQLRNHEWTCDMYGIRSHLQVQHGVKLYRWPEATWHNEGAQVTSDYKAEDTALVSRDSRFEDEVKLTADGQLVSRLSLKSPRKQVLAYSVCKTL